MPGTLLPLSLAGLMLAGPDPTDRSKAASELAAPATITVTATRTGDNPAASTSTIDAQDIRQRQPISLLDTLNDLPGVRAISTNGVSGGSFVSIRGGEPNFTLVMIDGVRLNDPTNSAGGAFDFNQIDPGLVAGVTVARGAGSAIFGSDALSGTINIHLRDPVPGAAATAALATGASGLINGTATIGEGWNSGSLLAGGGVLDSGDNDGVRLRRRDALTRVRQQVGVFDVRLLGFYASTDRLTFPEDSGGPDLAVNRQRETGNAALYTGALSVQGTRGSLRPNLLLSYSEQHGNSDVPAITPGALSGVPALTADDRFKRFEATANLLWGKPNYEITVGAAALHELGDSAGTIDYGFKVPTSFALSRTTWGGFAEVTARPAPGVVVNAAVRYDAVEAGPRRWTGSASVSYRLSANGPLIFARAGNGFKLPSFYALGHPLVGNPLLRPESSRDVEAGLEWTLETHTGFRVSWFDNHYGNLIDFDPTMFKIVNRSSVRAEGFEISAYGRFGPLQTSAAMTYVALTSDALLLKRPKWQGNLRVAWPIAAKIQLSGAVRFNSSFNDSSIPTGAIVTSGHVEGDVGARYQLTPIFAIDALLRDMGNARAQDAVGFPGVGREARIRLTLSI